MIHLERLHHLVVFGSEQEQAPWSNTCPVSSAESPTNKSTGASISIGYWNVTINDADGNSTRGNITCSNGNFSEWGDQPNGTQSCPLALLDFATNYTVWVNFTDALGICSINETYWFITQNTPTMTGISPSDGNNSVQPGTVNLSALFNDTDGDNMNVTFYYANNWTSIGSNTTITNGTYSQYISVGYGDVVSWGINLTDNTTWINNTYTFTVIDLNPVSSVVVSNYDSQGINLTWSKNSNVSHTYIR